MGAHAPIATTKPEAKAPVIRTHRDDAKIRVSLASHNLWRPPTFGAHMTLRNPAVPTLVAARFGPVQSSSEKKVGRLRRVVAVLIVCRPFGSWRHVPPIARLCASARPK